MKRCWPFLCALVAIAGAGLSWRTKVELRATEIALTDVAEARSQIAAESDRVLKSLEEAKARRTELEAELTRLNTAAAGRTPSIVSAAVTPAPVRRESTPREDAARVARFRGGLAQRYSPFYREMGFTPEQAAKFEDLLTEQESRQIDFRAAMGGSAAALSRAERDAVIAKETARAATELRQLLGEAGYARLQEYQNGGSHRRIVRELVSGLALTATPLSVEQGGQLMRVLAELSFQDSAGADREKWAPVLERAQRFLTPGQMAELQALATKSHGLAALNGLSRLAREAKP